MVDPAMTRPARPLTSQQGHYSTGPQMPKVYLLLISSLLGGACAGNARTSPGADEPQPPEPDAGVQVTANSGEPGGGAG